MEFDELITQFKAIQLNSINQTQELILKNLFNEVKINEFCMVLLQEWCKKNKKMDKIIENEFIDEDFQSFKESVEIAFKVFDISNKKSNINTKEEDKKLNEKQDKKKTKIEFLDENDNIEKIKKKKKIGNKFYYMYEGSNNVYDKNNILLEELINGELKNK